MQAQRINFLKELIKAEPNDPFNYYALALEYRYTEKDLASDLFSELLSKFEDYLPTYYAAAAFFFENNQIEKVEQIYEKGIQLADIQKNEKAKKELMGAFQLFKDETDEEL